MVVRACNPVNGFWGAQLPKENVVGSWSLAVSRMREGTVAGVQYTHKVNTGPKKCCRKVIYLGRERRKKGQKERNLPHKRECVEGDPNMESKGVWKKGTFNLGGAPTFSKTPGQ